MVNIDNTVVSRMIIEQCKSALKEILEDLEDTDLSISEKIDYSEYILTVIFEDYTKHIYREFVKQCVYEILDVESSPYLMDWTCPTEYINITLAINQPVQRSKEWFDFRSERLTASDIATALGENSYAKPKELILKKCGISKPFMMNSACQHGVKYEPISCMVYEFYNKTKVYEFGCISHKYYNFVGASPDGICEDGTMLEIKNPYSRTITGLPPKHYWIQMQIQMEVFDLQRCDFLECKMTEYADEEDYDNDTSVGNERKGVLVEYFTSENYKEPKYEYCPIEEEDKHDWIENEQKKFDKLKNTMYEMRVIWWKMDIYQCIRIYRDSDWWSETLPKLALFWDTIVNYRRNGKFTELIHIPKKRKKKCKLLIDIESDYPPENTKYPEKTSKQCFLLP